MIDAVDSSVLVAALVDSEPDHRACGTLLERGGARAYSHGLAETFSTLSGGRSGYRVPAKQTAELIEGSLLPYLEMIVLSPKEMLSAMLECQARGVRGAAIFDYFHLVSARKAKADRLYTLDVANFRSFHRTGDPEIVHP